MFRAVSLAVETAVSLAIEMAPFTRISRRGNTALLRACKTRFSVPGSQFSEKLKRSSY
jgi:hypothetical protein